MIEVILAKLSDQGGGIPLANYAFNILNFGFTSGLKPKYLHNSDIRQPGSPLQITCNLVLHPGKGRVQQQNIARIANAVQCHN